MGSALAQKGTVSAGNVPRVASNEFDTPGIRLLRELTRRMIEQESRGGRLFAPVPIREIKPLSDGRKTD